MHGKMFRELCLINSSILYYAELLMKGKEQTILVITMAIHSIITTIGIISIVLILLQHHNFVVLAQDQPIPYHGSFDTNTHHIINPLPHTYLSHESLPLEFTWQNVNGHSYLTRVRNQHIPQYCECCFYFGVSICYMYFFITFSLSLHNS